MGTRHLICAQHEGKYKVAQYGQWDGYPDYQGAKVLAFLREQFNREQFLARLADTYEATDEAIRQLYIEAGADAKKLDEEGLVDYGVAKKFSAMTPSLSRDTGSDILALIQNSTAPVPLRFDVEFAADSLFCEWAYVIDFDKSTFEVFKGFNRTPLAEGERFFGATCNQAHRTDEYQPVKLAAQWTLDALPDENAFLATFASAEEEESEEA